MIRSDETTEVERLAEQTMRYVWKIEDGGTHWICAVSQDEAILFHSASCEMSVDEYTGESLESIVQCAPTEKITVSLAHDEPMPDLSDYPPGVEYHQYVIVEPRMYLHCPETCLISTTEY